MPAKLSGPFVPAGRFSQRLSAGIGGNYHSGVFSDFPLDLALKRQYYTWFNDFDGNADFDVSTFEPNRTDGATAIARLPDWVAAEIGTSSLDIAPTLTTALLQTDAPFGVLKVLAGGTDSTGNQVTRSFSGSSIASGVPLNSTSTTDSRTGVARYRRTIVGARFNLAENGTASQSAMSITWNGDENAILTTAGAVAGNNQFGFHKALASNTLSFLTRGSSSSLTTVTTLVPGVAGAEGTYVDVAAVMERRSSTGFYADIYVNGVYTVSVDNSGSSSTITPGAATYAPSMAVVNGVGADADLYVDYIWHASERF